MHLPWPNSGDYGLNLLSLGMIALLGPIVWLCLRAKTVSITPTCLLLFASAVLFTLPAFWREFSLILRSCSNPSGKRKRLPFFYLLAAAAVIECALSLAGFYCPQYLPNSLAEKYSGYAPGIFQQVNVTASFLATGLAALLGTVILQPSVVASLQHKGSNQQR